MPFIGKCVVNQSNASLGSSEFGIQGPPSEGTIWSDWYFPPTALPVCQSAIWETDVMSATESWEFFRINFVNMYKYDGARILSNLSAKLGWRMFWIWTFPTLDKKCKSYVSVHYTIFFTYYICTEVWEPRRKRKEWKIVLLLINRPFSIVKYSKVNFISYFYYK